MLPLLAIQCAGFTPPGELITVERASGVVAQRQQIPVSVTEPPALQHGIERSRSMEHSSFLSICVADGALILDDRELKCDSDRLVPLPLTLLNDGIVCVWGLGVLSLCRRFRWLVYVDRRDWGLVSDFIV